MKICLFTTSLNRGGAERVFVNLANYWCTEGYEVDFVVLSKTGDLRDELEERVNLVDLNQYSPRLPARIAVIIGFAKYLISQKPDRVYATLTYVTLTALWARKLSSFKGRVIVRQANSLSNQSNQSLPVRLWNWFGYRVAYRWADIVLVNSKNSESEVAEILPSLKHKLRLIYNPVIVDQSLPAKASKPQSLVVTAGRFARQKDYPTLLRAFKHVRESSDARLVVLGDGPLRGKIEADIEQLGLTECVDLKGSVKDPQRYYSEADVFVLTSLWEGFPNVLVEALACGTAVVATDAKGASREIVEPILPNNIVGIGDDEAIAERILEVLADLPDRQALSQYVDQRFSIKHIAEQYIEV